MDTKGAPGSIDVRIGHIADRQFGLISALQLLELGLSRAGIDDRVRTCRLRRIHRGVYAVGHRALRREASWLAAVLACGPGAVLSHRSAAVLRAGLRTVRITSRALDDEGPLLADLTALLTPR